MSSTRRILAMAGAVWLCAVAMPAAAQSRSAVQVYGFTPGPGQTVAPYDTVRPRTTASPYRSTGGDSRAYRDGYRDGYRDRGDDGYRGGRYGHGYRAYPPARDGVYLHYARPSVRIDAAIPAYGYSELHGYRIERYGGGDFVQTTTVIDRRPSRTAAYFPGWGGGHAPARYPQRVPGGLPCVDDPMLSGPDCAKIVLPED
ncbi:hypothetical protein K4L06_19645 [Lysobacter sp. BMK333-48F3]|uniref:hypothetical protein n=1 Tax=Lysobacter sp. BMK333-48F3 TaxID=2867962 RepID=UPI001C8BEA9A|nr:hypothetical protein [Lysobacter sp. BMK333-48F3]MBX9403531.1 hypothetical protein [Lysobacter sp. BMK333-48F3]